MIIRISYNFFYKVKWKIKFISKNLSLSRDAKIATKFKVTSPAKAGRSDNQDNNAAVIKSEHDGHERDDITSPRSDFVKTESNEVESSKSPLSDSRDANTATSIQLGAIQISRDIKGRGYPF